MGKLLYSYDDVVVVTWLWAITLASWPEAVSAAPHLVKQRQTNGVNTQNASVGEPSQALIIGLAAGLASIVLILLTVTICFRPRKWLERAKLIPGKPLIHSTTTTVVTTQDRSRSRGSRASESPSTHTTFSPVPMTRIAILDRRGGGYLDPFEDDSARDAAGPSSRQPPGAARYSVHVGAQSRRSISSRRGALPPLEEGMGGPRTLITPTPPSRVTNSTQSDYFGHSARGGSVSPRSDLADRRGRPFLQNIHVPSPAPSSTSSIMGEKGKGKARVYYHR